MWQSYVLGQDVDAAVTSDAEQGETTLMPVTSTIDVPAADTGFDVQYRLDVVDEDGKVITAGTPQNTPDLAVELSEISGSAYYKLTAVVTAKDESGASVTVPADNTIGVLAVANAPATTIVAVPWESITGGAISVSNLVRTANLTPGDTLKAYTSDGNYKAWELQADKTWKPVPVAGGSEETAADAYTVPRGAGVWLTRQHPEEPIYLVGTEPSDAVSTTDLAKASGDKPSWNLVASPKIEPENAGTLLGVKTGDQIVVPTAGAPKNYVYVDGKGWGYWTTKEVVYKSGRKGVKSVFKTDDLVIPAGTGFFYLNSSSDDDAKINW